MTGERNNRPFVTHVTCHGVSYPQDVARPLRAFPLVADCCGMEPTAVDALIQAQDRIVTRSQLRGLGLPKSTIQSRLRPGGPWQRLLPATYLAQTGPPSLRQLSRAALLYVSQDSKYQVMLTGLPPWTSTVCNDCRMSVGFMC